MAEVLRLAASDPSRVNEALRLAKESREEAERLVRRMQFLDKLAHEVRDLEERLDD